MTTTEDTGPRRVLPGSCTWCGHPPHETGCAKHIRTGTKQTGPCPCPTTMETT